MKRTAAVAVLAVACKGSEDEKEPPPAAAPERAVLVAEDGDRVAAPGKEAGAT